MMLDQALQKGPMTDGIVMNQLLGVPQNQAALDEIDENQ